MNPVREFAEWIGGFDDLKEGDADPQWVRGFDFALRSIREKFFKVMENSAVVEIGTFWPCPLQSRYSLYCVKIGKDCVGWCAEGCPIYKVDGK